jgi:hypothetical protein
LDRLLRHFRFLIGDFRLQGATGTASHPSIKIENQKSKMVLRGDVPMMRSAIVWGTLLAATGATRADSFDNYLNTHLSKIPETKWAEKIEKLDAEAMIDNARVLPGINGTFVVVRTNEGRWAKLLVQAARHKVSAEKSVPIVLLERFVTYREGEERTTQAKGEHVRLFHDFRFNLEIGQVVPASLGGDLRFVAEDDKVHLEPVGKAELYLVTKHLAETNPKKGTKLVVGEKFEPRYFTGIYNLYDDGRRSGMLHLKVHENNIVSGAYYSDKDGAKYELEGKVGTPAHSIQFVVTYPRTVQHFTGMLFTGDGRAITGFTRLQDRETGFYAVRVEQ